MILLVNIGNSNTQFADSDGESIVNIRSVPTAKLSSDLFPKDRKIVISSVVPAKNSLLSNNDVFFIKNEHAKSIGLDLSFVEAETLGNDRLANMFELVRRNELPSAVMDFGTAITIEVVNRGKVFVGGSISPGRMLMHRSLSSGTALLPDLPISDFPPVGLGIDTASSILLGVDRGVIGLVRELINVTNEEFGGRLSWFSTGGDAKYFEATIPELTPGGLDFTLHGLLYAYQLNN